MKRMEFKDGDRVFTCRTETSPATPDTLWWWMSVTGESARYAAFRAEACDTAPMLRARILAYYEKLLADRARPMIVRPHWSQRRAAPPTAEGDRIGAAAEPVG